MVPLPTRYAFSAACKRETMAEYLVDLLEWMRMLSPLWAYVLLAVISFGENVVPPIPGDLAIVFAGYLAGAGQLSIGGVVSVASVCGTFGFMTMYLLGRRFGDTLLAPDRFVWLPSARVYRARRWLLKWGYLLVAANRFLSGLRSVISITAGAAQMHVGRTAVFASISSLLWTGLIAYAGMVLGENWEVVVLYLRRYSTFIVMAIVLIIVAYGVRYVIARNVARRRRTGSDPDDS